jgi:hypothetical protein
VSAILKRKFDPAISLLFIFCLLLWAAYVLSITFGDPTAFSLVNKVFPLMLLLALLGAGYRIVSRNSYLIWSPLPWFLGVCAIYYGFGPLLYHFGTPESVSYVDGFYPVGENDLLRTNMLNAAGITLVLLGYQVGMAFIPKQRAAYSTIFNITEMKRLLFGLLVIGIPVKYLFLVPYRLGLLNYVLPGSILYLSIFTSLSIIVLFFMVHNGANNYRILLYLLIATELVTGLMSFSKLEVVVVLIVILFGIFLCRPRMNVFIAGSALIGLIYIVFLTPFINYGRLALRLGGTSSIVELTTSIHDYTQLEGLDVLGSVPNVQNWWIRLNYANSQVFAMNSYDSGNPGDTYSLIPFTVVPRILYPEKPIMTPGPQFNELVTGSDASSSGAGLFGEAYWNGGWLCVILSCLYVGIVYAIFTSISVRHIPEWELAYLPVIFAGIVMGLCPDGWFVAIFVGPLLQSVVLYFSIRYFIMPVLSAKNNCVILN